METEWHYAKGDQQLGPVTESELRSLAATGKLLPNDLVWNEEMTDWTPAGTINGLCPPSLVTVPSNMSEEATEFTSQSTDLPPQSSRKSSFMDTVRATGQLAANQAERVKLTTITLPKLYLALGKHSLTSLEYREEFCSQFEKLDQIQNDLTKTGNQILPDAKTLGDKAKAMAHKAAQTAQAANLSALLRSHLARLGKSVYEVHLDDSGPENVVAPIREALSRVAILDKEIAVLSRGITGHTDEMQPDWKRNPLIIGLTLVFCFPLGLFLMWTHTNWQPKTKWIISGVICFFVLLVGSSMKADKAKATAMTSDRGFTERAPSANAKSKYELGKEFELGDYKYRITNVDQRQQIGDEQASSGAAFVVVTYTIENCTKESQAVLSDDFSLLDSQGRKYNTSSKASTALVFNTEDKDFLLSELQPGLPRQMQQGFELPLKSLESELILSVPKKGLFSSGDAQLTIRFR